MSLFTKNLAQYWERIQGTLFPWLEEELDPLTEQQKQLVAILDLIEIEKFIPDFRGNEGRPPKERGVLARSYVAKMFYNIDKTTSLIERLKTDSSLRRICGWEILKDVPSKSTFSRAFAEFSMSALPQRVHEAVIKNTLGGSIILHNSRDSTATNGWEKPITKIKRAEQLKQQVDRKKKKPKRGRPRAGEEKQTPDLTRIEKQKNMTLEEMLNDLPTACDKGGKKDSKGNTMYWTGHKLHLDVVDGGIPVSAIVTSASLHDSQVAIPLSRLTAQRVTVLYDLMDSAYYVPGVIEESKNQGRIPLIDVNPRRNKELKVELEAEAKAQNTLNWAPAEKYGIMQEQQ